MLNDQDMRRVLQEAKVVAVVGHSDKAHRTSYQIGQYLRQVGYTVYAVNPTVNTINGQKSYASLADVPEPIDIVNVFRQSQHLVGVVQEAIDVGAKMVRAQLGVYDINARRLADKAGIEIVMNQCIRVDHRRLLDMKLT